MSGPERTDPFAALGLPAQDGLTDDDVRAAWRRRATATHPDRADGGDPARFAAAAAAYTVLRTRSGRGEALADLAEQARPGGPRPAAAGIPRTRPRTGSPETGSPRSGLPPDRGTAGGDGGRPARRVPAPAGTRSPTARLAARAVRAPGPMTARLLWRVRRGRPARLVLRVLIAAALGTGVAVVAGLRPATLALWVGAATWLLRTGRHDLAPPT